jgi:hypothetical protein
MMALPCVPTATTTATATGNANHLFNLLNIMCS